MVNKWFNDFITGFQFLTRIQLISHHESSLESFGRSARFFPLIGAIIGSLLALLLIAARWGFGGLGPQLSLIACLVIAEVAVTGALHWDGFMDTFDGVFSGRERERMLEIMKDSRVGAFGALALALALLARLSFLYDLDPVVLPLALVAMPTAGRLGIVFTITFFPYARPSGLGQVFPAHRQKCNLYIALAFFAVVFCLLGVRCLLAACGGLAIGLLFAAYVNRCLGGVTGDVYGAVNVVTELAVLFCFLVFC